MRTVASILLLFALAGSGEVSAAEAAHLDGRDLSLAWALPFAGLLLSIALLPQLAPHFWHMHFGKISAAWALVLLVPFVLRFGVDVTLTELLHTLLLEYLPFVILLFALFVVAGGIRVTGNLIGTPRNNTALLAFGTAIASITGTTGAAMLLVRPLIQANLKRTYNAHVLVFFIFLVANIGGSLTPLGDPPLFLGFLKGVDFGWTVNHMFAPMMVCSIVLLGVFYALDRWYWMRDGGPIPKAPCRFGVDGLHNVLYLVGVVGAVLLSGLWKPEISVPIGPVDLPLPGLIRDIVLVSLAGLSWATTNRKVRIENAFTWAPILEVAYLFAGIFITIIPALAILRAGQGGALADVVALVSRPDGTPDNVAYFWLTGLLSSVLDNAPTYLVFFNLAGGDAQTLMGPLSSTLLAISAGAVFMGALTYIGNAPNFMVRAIASERGIRMPSFFGYMLWGCGVLLPVFVLVTWIFFIL